MKSFAVVTLLGLFAGAQAQTLFYGGDFNGVNGHASQIGGNIFDDIRVYDDFTIDVDSMVTGVFGNFLVDFSPSSGNLYWEIRQGITPGNGGTVVHAGTTSAAVVNPTGSGAFGYTEYNFTSEVTPFDLTAGTYFLTVAVVGGGGEAYLSDTSGANSIGTPIGNDNSFIDAWDPFAPGGPSHYINFESSSARQGVASKDYSMGVHGIAAVPEPTSILAIGLGIAALARRKRQTA